MLLILPARINGTISINLGQHILPVFMLFFFNNYFSLKLLYLVTCYFLLSSTSNSYFPTF